MLAVPNDTHDFAYTVPFFKVASGGVLRIGLLGGDVQSLPVVSGQYVNMPIRRIYRTGTTASGFQTDLQSGCNAAVRNLTIPYEAGTAAGLLDDDGVPLQDDDGTPLLV